MKYYELLEHTADLGIRVWGDNLERLFVNAAAAMYELLSDLSSVSPKESFKVEVEAQDRDELLRNWLAELLYYFHTKETLLSEFRVNTLSDKKITSIAKGERINRKRHILKHDIKAVTFHNLKIEEKGQKFSTDIIFDV